MNVPIVRGNPIYSKIRVGSFLTSDPRDPKRPTPSRPSETAFICSSSLNIYMAVLM